MRPGADPGEHGPDVDAVGELKDRLLDQVTEALGDRSTPPTRGTWWNLTQRESSWMLRRTLHDDFTFRS